jgi:hypothetical protein
VRARAPDMPRLPGTRRTPCFDRDDFEQEPGFRLVLSGWENGFVGRLRQRASRCAPTLSRFLSSQCFWEHRMQPEGQIEQPTAARTFFEDEEEYCPWAKLLTAPVKPQRLRSLKGPPGATHSTSRQVRAAKGNGPSAGTN